MSITGEALAPCSRCGKKSKIEVYKSINTADDPELKDRVRNGSLFIWECPECHQANLAKYECLYHDPEKKIMVWLMPSGDLSETQMQAVSNHARAMGDYKLRLVGDVGELMEKVLIFDAGLDDMAVEICKYVTKMELMSKKNAGEASLADIPFHFHRIEENEGVKYLVFIYPSDGRMMSINIGYNVYEDSSGILQRNPDIIPGGTFLKIDRDWLASVIKY